MVFPVGMLGPRRVTQGTGDYWWRASTGKWQDLAKTSPATADGQEVRVWTDTLASLDLRNHTGGSTVDGPDVETSAINGLVGIDFPNGPSLADNVTLPGLLAGDDVPFTHLQVLRLRSIDAFSRASFSLVGVTGVPTGIHKAYTINTPAWRTQRSADGTAATTVSGSGATPLIATDYIRVHRFNGTTLDEWVNGTRICTAAALDVGTLTVARYIVGGTQNTGVGPIFGNFDGWLCENKIWLYAVDDDTVDSELDFFASLYGITL